MTDRSDRAERRRILRRRNPFASVSVGDPLDAAADDRFPDVPSINEAAFAAIRDLIAQKADRPWERFAVMVLGEVGEGKTHLMARLRRYSQAADPPFSFAYIQPIEDPERPFGYLLREWVANLCMPDEKGHGDAPIDALLGAVFREVIEAEVRDRPPRHVEALIREMRADPAAIFRRPVREEAYLEMEKRVRRRIRPYLPRVPEAFWIALTGLRDPHKRYAAAAWLQGALLRPADARRLGVSPERATETAHREDAARRRLTALSDLMTRYRRISVLCFDRLENLETPEQIRAFGRMMEFMVDALPAALPVVCFRGFQWEETLRHKLNQHVVTRLEANRFQLEGCTPDQAVAVIRSRLAAVLDLPEGADLYPFDEGDLLAAFSGGMESPREVVIQANRMLREQLGEAAELTRPVAPEDALMAAFEAERRAVAADFDHHPPDRGRLRRALRLYLTLHPAADIAVRAGDRQVDFFCDATLDGRTVPMAFIIDTEAHHLSVGAAFDRGIAHLEGHDVSGAVYIRDDRRPIPETWRATRQRQRCFQRLGGRAVDLGRESAVDWYALTRLFYRVSAGEIDWVDADGEPAPVPPDRWRAFVRSAIQDGKIAGFADLDRSVMDVLTGSREPVDGAAPNGEEDDPCNGATPGPEGADAAVSVTTK
jgi:hypothetical protein